ncbi:hypothetical protein [Clostridium algidicarnis]|uniref:hypothetical protein n=1 Tax=Clostridium algidicarnis TaxID=37659 RepID=UPI001C0E0929|nr:hypothetical protein [Clostridium algidicarnis]MBU3209060.1 hypothetical protein [Clostridium algidicarnis]MBU3228780.1 hypothetical protein [Clostridium algidicarnis]MBU3252324.1 hypothetical protein [Clostridium algidicarnis]
MKMPVTILSYKDVQSLRRKGYATNGRNIFLTEKEVKEMKDHLDTLYEGKVQMSFAEKIACRNKEY